jgi:two-component system chemotaxis sensor kinase CheA
MAQDDPDLQELISDFVNESREHLASVEADLLGLEGAADDHAGEEPIHRVFRAVHSVKGVAGFLGLENINRLAHALESVLDQVRKGHLAISGALVSELLSATDLLRELIDKVMASNEIPIDAQVQSLQRHAEELKQAARPAVPAPAAVDLQPGQSLVQLTFEPHRLALLLGITVEDLAQHLAGFGRVVHGGAALVACASGGASREALVVQLVLDQPPAAVQQALRLEPDQWRVLSAMGARPAAVTSQAPLPVSTESAAPTAVAPARASATAPAAAAPAAAAPASAEPQQDSIRVSVHLLDKLMNLSGELVLGRNQLLQAFGVGNAKGVGVSAARLDQVVSEVQEAVMQTRMQPVGNLFQRFPRVVRDLAGKLGKRCRLEIDGRGVDLDRTILEGLGDPLTHLVRNAVDHGMERPEERVAAGKDAEGVVQIVAAQQGGNVRITITDNGRGIDPVRLRNKAVEKGLLGAAEAQALSDREAVHLIFAPGFSTAEKVTDVSGRGVGMDVVRSNIEKLGGHVDVHSAVGRGTTIAITIPLTLAILPAMVIDSGNRRYVLPQANVAELVRIRTEEVHERIRRMEQREVLRLRGRVLPLLRLSQVLGEPPSDTGGVATTIIVVETGSLSYGLVVDAPPDAEEIVVKPLGRHLKGRAEYAGATILGDGRVAMILDVAGIAEVAQLAVVELPQATDGSQVLAAAVESADLVLFRNHPNETFALPLGLVERIQRVATSSLQAVGGRLVYQDDGTLLPIIRLEQHLQVEPGPVASRQTVLVVRLGAHRFGILAPRIEDIRRIAVRMDDRTLSEPGLLGSIVYEGVIIRMIDAAALGRLALPQWFADQPVAAVPVGSQASQRNDPVRVLFAEDTKFFREHVSRTLRDAGFEVVAAPDGEAAWEALQSAKQPFDVVVTDVQMPNCDGLELTRRIRRTEKHAALPVMALTSLSSAEDEARGQEAGVTSYLIKLDDAALVAAVRQHAGVKA